jgi:succinoglycan biosynthesis protein ExoA
MISVLVPFLNEERHIADAVAAMRAQTYAGEMEFLLIDGGSTDGTRALLDPLVAGDERFRVIDDPGTTVPARLNRGLRESRGELIARMDAHALFPPRYLELGARRLAAGDVIAVGEGPWSRRVALALRSRLGRGEVQFRHLPASEVEIDSGYCGMWRRDLLESHGGWNELASSGEDTELAARVRRAGGRIVCVPEMAAIYQPRDTLKGLALQYGRYAHRRAWIARRHPEVLRPSHALPPAIVVAIALSVLGRPTVARAARRGLTLYVAALALESARVGRDAPLADAVALPAVYATMHVSWGAGFLAGCLESLSDPGRPERPSA